MKRKILTALVLSFVAVLLVASSALATDLPDSMTIDETYVYRNLLQSGDVLFVATYNIAYTDNPDDPINETFIFRLLDTDNTTELGSVLAYPYFQTGYGLGIISFYFDNTTAPTWGESYIIRISGNPTKFSEPPEANFVISTSGYFGLESQEANQTALAARVISIAEDLESAWSATLLTSTDTGGTVFNTAGQIYFTNAIPGLQNMAPGAFSVEVVDPTYTPRSWSTTQADAYRDRFVGTWVMDSVTALGDFFTLNAQLTTSIPIALVCVLLLVVNATTFGSATPGIIDAFQVKACGVLLGFVSMAVSSVVTLLMGLLLVYILFFEKS